MKEAVLAAVLTLALAVGAELLLGFVHCVCPVGKEEACFGGGLGEGAWGVRLGRECKSVQVSQHLRL